jgi:hypothetical protein
LEQALLQTLLQAQIHPFILFQQQVAVALVLLAVMEKQAVQAVVAMDDGTPAELVLVEQELLGREIMAERVTILLRRTALLVEAEAALAL